MVWGMWKCVRIMGWILLAPVMWVAGSMMLVSLAPEAYTLERQLVQALPQSPLSAYDVAELNERLEQYDGYYKWHIAPFCAMFSPDTLRAVPASDDGVELVRFRPALGWVDVETQALLAQNEKGRLRVLQEWLAEMRKKGELCS